MTKNRGKEKPMIYNDFTIQMRGEGFQMPPNVAGRVVSFWVVNKEKDIRSIFAFARPFLGSFEYVGKTEDQLIEDAISLIKKYIDDHKIKDLEEYPFKYENGQFFSDHNAGWWKKTL